MAAKPREFKKLKKADLIFLAPLDRPHRMGHVMLYAGGDAFLDANIKDRCVVVSSAQQRFGRPFHQISWGQAIGQYYVFFGTFEI